MGSLARQILKPLNSAKNCQRHGDRQTKQIHWQERQRDCGHSDKSEGQQRRDRRHRVWEKLSRIVPKPRELARDLRAKVGKVQYIARSDCCCHGCSCLLSHQPYQPGLALCRPPFVHKCAMAGFCTNLTGGPLSCPGRFAQFVEPARYARTCRWCAVAKFGTSCASEWIQCPQ